MKTRRQFLHATAVLGALVTTRSLRAADAPAAAPPSASSRPKPAYPKPQVPEHDPQLEAEMVKAFVIAAHADLELTRSMLAAVPELINATWDWGNGDFETALGGASHMGRRDIALFLLERRARLDVFAATMLGRLEIVRPMLEAFPNLLNTPGPHGIPLIRHAHAGGSDAAATLAFLQELTAKRP